MILVDATDQILGRMASIVAKRLLEGERVTIVNAEKAIITGDPTRVKEKFKTKFDLARVVNPRRGPFFPRTPDRIVSRAIRGMLPWSKPRGKEAFRRLRVYRGVPEELKDQSFTSFPEASAERLGTRKFVRVGEVSVSLGIKQEAVF